MAERTPVEEDLRGIVAGEVVCDDAARGLYATDGSLFEARPLAVVRPRSADDVAATVGWAAERGIPVHARGGGSSICGGPLGAGVVIDCARFMRRIVRTDVDSGTVRVQPGVVAAQLEAHVARFGRTFGPDPSNFAITTVGGMIGRNASGSRFLRHGAVRGRIAAAQVVLADGRVVELTPAPAEPVPAGGEPAEGAVVSGLAARVAAVLAGARATIARFQPSTRLSHGGFGLHDLESAGFIDLPRLLCGAEGTLGIVTEATLCTVPADGASAVGLMLFDSLDRAAETALAVRGLGPSACDLFDKRHLALARGTKPAVDLLIPPVAEAGLLVEFTADEPAACAARLDEAFTAVQRPRSGCIDVRRAENEVDAAFFWELSRTAVATLAGVRATVRPVPFIEDIVVPPPAVPEFLRHLQDALNRCEFTAMIFGHVGHGQLHVRPYADPRAAGERARLEALAEAVYAEVAGFGGTIGGELGLGLSRTPFFARLFPDLVAVFADVKRIFDPAGILNPGRVVPADGVAADFRPPLATPAAEARPAPPPLPVLAWPADRLAGEVDACNGCGSCRTFAAGQRMCPRYREDPSEEASPRAKANLVASVLAGRLDARALAGNVLRELADTCFNCHQCRSECAAGVDIPALVTELKAAHVAADGLDLNAWLLSRVDTLSAWGGSLAPLANRALADPRARWVLEKVLGIARGRKLPRFTGNQVLRWAARRGLTKPSRRSGPRVLYFLDTYARRHDPALARAFVEVLERHGVGVFIDPRQVAAGMPLVSAGDVDAARRVARRNMRVLTEAVRLGYRIVATEPAAVTCLKHDYPLLIDDEDMDRVIAATSDAASYLWELHREGTLRLDFVPLPAVVQYHSPCHVRAAGGTPAAERLLRLVPGLDVRAIDRGCSGMAGTFGLSRAHYRTSLRIGRGVMAAVRGGDGVGATECSACRLQMEQGTATPTIHPVKLLAKAWGLGAGPGPDGLDDLLTRTSGRLTAS
ncbi:MAG: FAD-binding and (Fe-S)-binding domain-containing protein [Planctomycetaceae bacterium]